MSVQCAVGEQRPRESEKEARKRSEYQWARVCDAELEWRLAFAVQCWKAAVPMAGILDISQFDKCCSTYRTLVREFYSLNIKRY